MEFAPSVVAKIPAVAQRMLVVGSQQRSLWAILILSIFVAVISTLTGSSQLEVPPH
jgi:hypothetical protein